MPSVYAAELRMSVGCIKILKVKVKVLPIQATKALRVGRGIALPYLSSALKMGVRDQQHAPAALPP